MSVAETSTRPRPDLAGRRLVSPRGRELYLIDSDGYRRLIPNHTTYDRLFRDWSGISKDKHLDAISLGRPFSTGTVLVGSDLAGPLYLLDHGRKRRIRSESVMDKYWFDPARVCLCRQALLDQLLLGREWE